MNTLSNLRNVALTLIVSLSIAGCTTLRPSRIPEMIQKLDQHEFSKAERETIGELLQYINTLENDL